MDKNKLLRSIPKIDEILQNEEVKNKTLSYPRTLVLDALRSEIDQYRNAVLSSRDEDLASFERSDTQWMEAFLKRIDKEGQPSLKKVINGTGIILHTNLGRSLLSEKILENFSDAMTSYSNLEYEIEKGERGSRYDHLIDIIKKLTGAEDALLVNNNAAAVLLVLKTLSAGGKAIVSRGELIEIGGSFRIPAIMEESGTSLLEVGSTNKTHLKDYKEAIDEETKLIMKVHPSNFHMTGFTKSVEAKELKALAQEHDLPLYEDLGSGVFMNLEKYGLRHEPTVQESLDQGVDVLSFSGDKLLGGPQAGVIVGKKKYIDQMKKNQLLRALRVDKMTIYLLEETLRLYLDEKIAETEIPTLRMISKPSSELQKKGLQFIEEFKDHPEIKITLEKGYSQIGGGSLPDGKIRSCVFNISLEGYTTNALERAMRLSKSHIIGRIQEDKYLLDLRTLQEKDYPRIRKTLLELQGQVRK